MIQIYLFGGIHRRRISMAIVFFMLFNMLFAIVTPKLFADGLF